MPMAIATQNVIPTRYHMATPCLSGAMTAPIAVKTRPPAPIISARVAAAADDDSAGKIVEVEAA